jgi:hypothetical protein
MHTDLRKWLLLVESFRTPKVLYHGSKPELLTKIKKEGLTAETDVSWREFGKGVYLALTAEVARQYGPLVFAVSVSKLDQHKLGPDDDELAAYFRGEWGDDDDSDDAEDDYRPSGIHEATWLDSLRICQQCQYLGDIPPAALRVLPPPKPDSRVQATWYLGHAFDRDERGIPRVVSIQPANK